MSTSSFTASYYQNGLHRYNPGLLNFSIEEKKLNFLEREVRPILKDHPLFKSPI